MTSSIWDHSCRQDAAASVLTVIAVTVGMLVLGAGASVPQRWWPHTGHAFAADAQPTTGEPCALIVGWGKDYCERGATAKAATWQEGGTGPWWRLVPAGAAVAALAMWGHRGAVGQGRR